MSIKKLCDACKIVNNEIYTDFSDCVVASSCFIATVVIFVSFMTALTGTNYLVIHTIFKFFSDTSTKNYELIIFLSIISAMVEFLILTLLFSYLTRIKEKYGEYKKVTV